jgi:hypothetical protein
MNQKIYAWESDVTACDQSHNKGLIKAMLISLRNMGSNEDWLAVLEESYVRPIKTKNYKIRFPKPQLHTGQSQTSMANTLVVGSIPMWLMHELPIEGWGGDLDVLRDHVEQNTKKLGMIWKVEAHENYLNATFHKGFWVKGTSGHVWLPLPSCLWKATKIRCDSPIPWEELMLRLAFNLYQRIINNNVSTVSLICTKMFHYIVNTHMPKIVKRYGQGSSMGDLGLIMRIYEDDSSVFGAKFKKYVDINYINKSGESIDTSAQTQRTEWSRGQELDFFQHRYGCDDQDLVSLVSSDSNWDGEFGVFRSTFMLAAIQRDYGSTLDTYEDDLLYREEGGHADPVLIEQ